MKRQRCRSEEYRARRWELKRARRKRRDPSGAKGIYTVDDAMATVQATNAVAQTNFNLCVAGALAETKDDMRDIVTALKVSP